MGNHTNKFWIGVVMHSKIDDIKSFFCMVLQRSGYGLIGRKGKLHAPGHYLDGKMNMRLKENDVVEIVLFFKGINFKYCRLGYKQNGGDMETAFTDLSVDESYHIAVA